MLLRIVTYLILLAMKYCLLVCLLFSCYWQAKAQISDSLYKALPDTLRPKNKLAVTDQECVAIIADGSRPLFMKYYDNFMVIIKQLEKNVVTVKDDTEKIPYADAIAHVYMDVGDYDTGFSWNRKLTLWGKAAKKYQRNVCNAYNNMALYYSVSRKQDSAMVMLYKATDIANTIKDPENLRLIYFAYAQVYTQLQLYPQVLVYINKFLNAVPAKSRWKDLYTEQAISKGVIYAYMFRNENRPEYADSARAQIASVMKAKKNQAFYWYFYCYRALGLLAYYQEDYPTAIHYFDLALSPEYSKAGSYQPYLPNLYKNTALVLMGHAKSVPALLAVVIPPRDQYAHREANRVLYQYYKQAGNYNKALDHYIKYIAWNDSINIARQRGKVFEAQQKYSVAQKEAAIAQLENKNLEEKNAKRDIAIVSLIILLVLLLLYLYNRRQLAKRALEGQQLADKLQTMEKEMALQQIKQRTESESALNAQRKSISRNMHDEVSSSVATLRFLIKDRIGHTKSKETKQVLAELEDETTEVYQQVRDFMHRLHVSDPTPQYDVIDFLDNLSLTFGPGSSLQVKTRYDAENIECHFTPTHHAEVYLFIKEAVSNAMKHSGASQLTIELFAKNGNTYIDVRDNGKGLDNNTRGIGMESMQERMKVLGGEVKFWTNKGLCILASFPVVQATAE